MKNNKIFVINEGHSLEEVAKYILDNLTINKTILLNGNLGAGKTTLIKKIAELIGIKSVITSPTFNYMKKYEGLVHIDAYYLNGDIDEFIDYVDKGDILAIEWAQNLDLSFSNYILISINIGANNEHIFDIKVVK
ncbi:tRNA (adenosine(37)-N6)-threonylcarbamoyltransferase complex ATPase subunit type 1 TsaE [Mycoplasma tauri]|uniref:tRNA (adenosine(37)-N6)-threonylcarbamoyltransferase complex ATPase subunit type 1 TsaE n=1 Tax=Mycoplasma tauri TaxID=547987 RepID=UPI0019670EA2|nr:tRNA (adenosine(37)-N6)-threonylcarbamoyltransferase complex ATPase subunit type 1 TsaE [Mycoplasma tauri]MBZ4203883.1 tRNA (adenosine(37)-N6)-threonylcarbamoyltransferase complex ATPase subunit type 1 TsaE [Mycoplasma tauri]MBZ4204553.1 tRNA (adenosine(37)-N6)-threonylcarbamoyltransferase complex ATPase subunit type 1 TsaE [Mycoplasma tauri]MBZ4226926.1 tRNA (adenosine(37)-N6)-threonylcarbamoyltransferase complex ATPase subunit type 1 TsaE [Mycoplasma tauri]QSB07790.1 tRNA (adenosine(37)-N6